MTEIVADVFTKQGSQKEVSNEIIMDNVFKHSKNEGNMVCLEDDEIKIRNLTMKADKKCVK